MVVTLVAALATAVVGLLRYLRGRRKGRIDRFYSEALAIRAKLLHEQDPQQRRVGIAELRTLRDRAFSLLIKEKLSADESFRILQNLIGDLIQEFDPPAEQPRATTG